MPGDVTYLPGHVTRRSVTRVTVRRDPVSRVPPLARYRRVIAGPQEGAARAVKLLGGSTLYRRLYIYILYIIYYILYNYIYIYI